MTELANKNTFNILVLDASQRSALAVVRSLGKSPQFSIVTAESQAEALAGHSRFSKEHYQHPNPISSPSEFISWLGDFCTNKAIDLVLPVTEITSQLILMRHAQIPHVKLPFGNHNQVMQLADKGQLFKFATTLDIDAPYTEWFDSATSINTDNFDYPLVIKPCRSRIFSEEIWINTTVKVVFNKQELDEHLKKTNYLQLHPFMIQEFIPGTGAGIFCLFNNGEPVAFFAHKRIREKPPQGGVSVLSESAEVDPYLREQATKLLSAVKWHGVAMIEYRVNPEGKAYLMEVNTRFWGSLQLAIDSGVDFPTLLVSNELGIIIKPNSSYKIGQRLRWLLGDVDSLYLYLKSDYSLKQKLIRLIAFITPNIVDTKHEINRWNDMAPAWFEVKSYIKHFIGGTK